MFGHIFHRKPSTKPEAEPGPETNPGPVVRPGPEKKQKRAISMVPLFSVRTFLVIVIGLVLGVLIALGYWVLSPSFVSSGTQTGGSEEESSGLAGMLGLNTSGPYQSKIRIQIVSPGSEYMPLKNLQQLGEYYSAKAHSLPFFEFLSKKLSQQMPESTYDAETLAQMVSTAYDYNSELPIIVVTVVAPTKSEAVGLAGLVPEDFRNYLISEEEETRQAQYDSTLKEIESVKEVLYTAQQDLAALQPEEALNTNPQYLSLKAKVDTLQQQLDTQTAQLVSQNLGNSDINTEYDDTVAKMMSISTKIEAAKYELQTLEQQTNGFVDETPGLILNAKVNALQAELDRMMTGYIIVEGNTQTRVAGLAEMIANGDTTSPEYLARVTKVETVSKALAEAKKELSDLGTQSSMNLYASTNYQIAQIKLDTLNAQLEVLKEKTRTLYTQIIVADEEGGQTDLQSVVDKTSAALADAKQELSNLEAELGYDRLAVDLDYKIAQDKVSNLQQRLETLTQQLGSLVGSSVESQESSNLVAGNPSVPYPVLPTRARAMNTLLIGAIAGVIVGWVLLNFRWISKGMPSSTGSDSEGNGEKE